MNRLHAGTITESKNGSTAWDTSMAKAIEDAFLQEWPHVVPGQPAPTGDALLSMRLMFVAVARGVVRHLHENPDAFEVQPGGNNNHDHDMEVNGEYE